MDFNREELEGHLRQSRRDLPGFSTVGLEEALASDWEAGEEPAVEKLPPDSLLLTGLERRRGLGIAGRRVARASPVLSTGNSLASLAPASRVSAVRIRLDGGTWDLKALRVGSVSLGTEGRSRELPASMGWECINVKGCRG